MRGYSARALNLLLLTEADLVSPTEATLTGRRLEHAREVLRAQAGETLRVGLRDGKLGTAEVLEISQERLRLSLALSDAPPPRAGISLLLAIPRPKQLKRIIPAVASLGVDTLVLVNAARVEKSYFDSRVLNDEFLDGLIVQGLEQAKDTVSPRVLIRERFKPFVEDELAVTFPNARKLLPHPPASRTLAELAHSDTRSNVVLAIGPEGGWVPFEAELLEKHGFEPFTLGPRILRTEAAVPLLIGQAQLFREGALRT